MTVHVEDIGIGMGDHVVHFYEHEADLARSVGGYLRDAIDAAAVSIVIATEAHRRAFRAELDTTDVDSGKTGREGALIMLDAAETMVGFMPDGRVERGAFRDVVGAILRQAGASGKPLRVYGEMVALLWEAGHVPAAIEVEELWNELAREVEFSLLCAYRREAVQGAELAEALERVCHLHSSVLHPPIREHEPSPAGREVSAQFAAEPSAPRAARRFVAAELRRSGHRESLVDDAQLVISELATNAVRHAGSPFSVTTRVEESGVRLSVHDASQVEPTLRKDGPNVPSGRGVRLVAALSVDWGVELSADGKTVWAELAA